MSRVWIAYSGNHALRTLFLRLSLWQHLHLLQFTNLIFYWTVYCVKQLNSFWLMINLIGNYLVFHFVTVLLKFSSFVMFYLLYHFDLWHGLPKDYINKTRYWGKLENINGVLVRLLLLCVMSLLEQWDQPDRRQGFLLI